MTKTKLIKNIASICRSLHSKGVNHRDLYLCHFHIKKSLDISKDKIFLIDLHRAQIRNKVPKRWIVKDIGGLYHSALNIGLTESDCYLFLKTYFDLPLREILSKHNRFLESSRKRAFSMYMKPLLQSIDLRRSLEATENERYIRGRKNNFRWIAKKEFVDEETLKIIKDPENYMDKGTVIKKEKGHFIIILDLKSYSLIIKKYQIKNLWHFLRKLFVNTRANTSWLASHWLNAVGINTVNHIAVMERYNDWGKQDSYLISRKQTGTRLDKFPLDKGSYFLISNRMAAFYKRLRWINFNHGDSKSSNFIIFNNRLFVFDLDVSKRSSSKTMFKIRNLRDIKRTVKSFEKDKVFNKILLKRLF